MFGLGVDICNPPFSTDQILLIEYFPSFRNSTYFNDTLPLCDFALKYVSCYSSIRPSAKFYLLQPQCAVLPFWHRLLNNLTAISVKPIFKTPSANYTRTSWAEGSHEVIVHTHHVDGCVCWGFLEEVSCGKLFYKVGASWYLASLFFFFFLLHFTQSSASGAWRSWHGVERRVW